MGHILDVIDQRLQGELIRFRYIFQGAKRLYETAYAFRAMFHEYGVGLWPSLQDLFNR
jgi:hypothetical protein